MKPILKLSTQQVTFELLSSGCNDLMFTLFPSPVCVWDAPCLCSAWDHVSWACISLWV